MKRKLKTITLGNNDEPTHVFCEGHVDINVFNDAFLNEGWSHGRFKQKDLVYEYYWIRKYKNGKIKFFACTPLDKGAKKFTVALWD